MECNTTKGHPYKTSPRSFIFKLLAFYFCFYPLFLLPKEANAQVTLLADSYVTSKGQTINVPIKVTGFSKIFSMQFSINWDSTVLDFKNVHSFTEELPQFQEDGIGKGTAKSGKLIAIWFDNSLTGISIKDSTALFVLQFEVIGEDGTNSPIAFTNFPALIEVVDANSSIIDVNLIDGDVSIPAISTATTYLQAENGMRLFQNHPNPFYKHTTIDVSFTSSGWTVLTITDALGRSVLVERFWANSGPNSFVLDKDKLSAAGIYHYTLQSGEYRLSKQMILLP